MVQKRDLLFDILELLFKENNHVRAIAKALNESHATILRRLNFLEEENVVDYKIAGKNKVYFIKKNIISRSYFLELESFKLRRLLKNYPELSIVFEEILKKTDEKLILLFGSYAKGLAKKNSDIDIYIATEDKKIKELIESVHSKISVKTGLFNNNSLLIKEIIKNHIVIRGLDDYFDEVNKDE